MLTRVIGGIWSEFTASRMNIRSFSSSSFAK